MTPVAQSRRAGGVTVVGGGLSGSVCARTLHDAGVRVRLLDRAREPGGRMASYGIDERAVDVGAAYFTVSDPDFAAQVERWQAAGLARPWTDTFHTSSGLVLGGTRSGPVRWAAQKGLRSLVADLQRGLAVTRSREVEFVDPGPLVDGELAEAVVLAMPDPQASDLLAGTLAEELAEVEDRPWTASLALIASWPERCWPDLDGVFVNEDPVLRWVADDGRRRGDGAPVLVAHSTAEFAAAHLDDPQTGVAPMLDALRGLLGIDAEPSWTKVKRWSLAHPESPREEPYFLGEAMVGLCGDGWHGKPRVEAAYLSGLELARALLARLQG